jgi:hypothetical protein
MRVVLDTNVLVSATLKQQSMPGMAALLVERRGGLLKSVATERQLFDVAPAVSAWLCCVRREGGADHGKTVAAPTVSR